MPRTCLAVMRIGLVLFLLLFAKVNVAQLDSLARNLVDTVKSRLIVDDIPRKTLGEKLMYPHRWYVRQLLAPRVPDFDTNYIISNKRRLTITLPVSKKFFGFNVNDLSTKRSLKFSPNNYYYLGFNLSNIIITFGFAPGIKFGAKPGRGTTLSKDFQVTVIGRRVITDINFQQYRGFYVYNTADYDIGSLNPASYVVRPDIKVFSFGVNTMYVFNSRKYSMRGAFSFTDVQRKSAGSFMAGIYHSHTIFSSIDTTFVKSPFKHDFTPLVSEVNKISVITIGVSGGYGYTFAYKKIIASSMLNLGVGGQKTNYTTIDKEGHTLSLNVALHGNAKASIRYDNLRVFTGFMATYDNNFTFNTKIFSTDNYIAKIIFFAGYRFNVKHNGRKLLKFMGLVDYEKPKKSD